MDIYELEQASGVVVSVGGQLPQVRLFKARFPAHWVARYVTKGIEDLLHFCCTSNLSRKGNADPRLCQNIALRLQAGKARVLGTDPLVNTLSLYCGIVYG